MRLVVILSVLLLATGLIGMALTSDQNVLQGPLAPSSPHSKIACIQKVEAPSPLGGTHDCSAHHTSDWYPADPTDVKTEFYTTGDTIEFVCLIWDWTGCEPTADTISLKGPLGHSPQMYKLPQDWGGYCIPSGSWWLMYWVWFPPPVYQPGPYAWAHKLIGVDPPCCKDPMRFTMIRPQR